MHKKPPHSSRVRRLVFHYVLPVVLPVIAFGFGAGIMLSRSHYSDRVNVAHTVAQPVSPAPTSAPSPLQLSVHRPENLKFSGSGDSSDPTSLVQYEEHIEDAARAVVDAATATLAPDHTAPATHKQIAIVIDDVGPDRRGAREAIALPAAITLAFLPYSETLPEQLAAAHAARHQVIVHMPMEPDHLAQNNPGPQALLISLTAPEIRQRLDAALSAVKGEVGLNNHMGSRYTASVESMQPVMEELAHRNLFFLDSRTTAESVGKTLAQRYGVRYVARDVFLDNDLSPAAIARQLDDVVRIADRKGAAVAIGHPHAETLAALRHWIPQMQQRGYQFVPVATLARQQPATATVADRR